jgi:sodium pump decarboxylase gamma subunit
MLLEGVNLMVVGMTAVFGFLTLLVVVLQISARVFESFGDRWPDPAIAPPSAPMPISRRDAEVAVALAAIEAHRRESR